MQDNNVTIKFVEEYLINHNIRPSVQRVAVMKYLFEHHTHPTTDDIYKALVPHISSLSRTTIYNTIHLLAEANAIKEITIEDNICHYDYNVNNHAHFYCKNCGKIYDVTEQDFPLLKLLDDYLKKDERVEKSELFIYGKCTNCTQLSQN